MRVPSEAAADSLLVSLVNGPPKGNGWPGSNASIAGRPRLFPNRLSPKSLKRASSRAQLGSNSSSDAEPQVRDTHVDARHKLDDIL